MKKKHIYALYKGDKFVDMGTKEYLAQRLGVDKKTIDYYGTKTQRERSHENGYMTFLIKDDDNE